MKLYPLCKPNTRSVFSRMRRFRRDQFKDNSSYINFGGYLYPIEIFGINNPSNTGLLTIDDIINELKLIKEAHK